MNAQLPALTLTKLTHELGKRTRALELLKWLPGLNSIPAQLRDTVPGSSTRAWGAPS